MQTQQAPLVKLISEKNGVLHLALNRPAQLNALSNDLLDELYAHLIAAKNAVSIRGILLSGVGKHFCAGADIKELETIDAKAAQHFTKKGQTIFSELEALGKPSLAVIQGVAFGGGCELAMACTLRIATKEAFFAQPEIKLGIIPGFGGTQRLSRLIGKSRALSVCLTGKRFSAEEAMHWGFLHEVSSEENLLTRAHEIINTVIAYSPTAVRAIINSINDGYNLPSAAALKIEASYFAQCCDTEDKREGVAAFLEKREPVFSGK